MYMKTLYAALTLLALSTVPAKAAENAYFVLQSSAAASAGSGRIAPLGSKVAFQADGRVSATTGAATVVIYGSLDGSSYITIGTITLTLGTTVTSDGFTSDNAWRFYKSSVTAISGTNAVFSAFAASKQ